MKTLNSNLLNEKEGIIIHGVNCQGAMGRGIAGQIRAMYPKVYEDYIEHILEKKGTKHFTDFNTSSLLGDIVITPINPKLYIISAFTQDRYGARKDIVYVDYDAVYKSFVNICAFNANFSERKILKFPKIGAGLANGSWEIIEEIINRVTYGHSETEFYDYIPNNSW